MENQDEQEQYERGAKAEASKMLGITTDLLRYRLRVKDPVALAAVQGISERKRAERQALINKFSNLGTAN